MVVLCLVVVCCLALRFRLCWYLLMFGVFQWLSLFGQFGVWLLLYFYLVGSLGWVWRFDCCCAVIVGWVGFGLWSLGMWLWLCLLLGYLVFGGYATEFGL